MTTRKQTTKAGLILSLAFLMGVTQTVFSAHVLEDSIARNPQKAVSEAAKPWREAKKGKIAGRTSLGVNVASADGSSVQKGQDPFNQTYAFRTATFQEPSSVPQKVTAQKPLASRTERIGRLSGTIVGVVLGVSVGFKLGLVAGAATMIATPFVAIPIGIGVGLGVAYLGYRVGRSLGSKAGAWVGREINDIMETSK